MTVRAASVDVRPGIPMRYAMKKEPGPFSGPLFRPEFRRQNRGEKGVGRWQGNRWYRKDRNGVLAKKIAGWRC